MAKERVQVQGLGDVAPGIQPTIQRAGQYGIQMQKAGRNKLMDLADALGQINPVLQQYGALQKQQEQIGVEQAALVEEQNVIAELKKQKDVDGFSLLATTNRDRAYRDALLKRHINSTMLPSLKAKAADLINAETYRTQSDHGKAVDDMLSAEWDNLVGQVGEGVANSTAGKALWNLVSTPYKNELALKYEEARDKFIVGQTMNEGQQLFDSLYSTGEVVSSTQIENVVLNIEDQLKEDNPALTNQDRNKLLVDMIAVRANTLISNRRYNDANSLLRGVELLEINDNRIFRSKDALKVLTPIQKELGNKLASLSKEDKTESVTEFKGLLFQSIRMLPARMSKDKFLKTDEDGNFTRRTVNNIRALSDAIRYMDPRQTDEQILGYIENRIFDQEVSPAQAFEELLREISYNDPDRAPAIFNESVMGTRVALASAKEYADLQPNLSSPKRRDEVVENYIKDHPKRSIDGEEEYTFDDYLGDEGIDADSWSEGREASERLNAGMAVKKIEEFNQLSTTLKTDLEAAAKSIDVDILKQDDLPPEFLETYHQASVPLLKKQIRDRGADIMLNPEIPADQKIPKIKEMIKQVKQDDAAIFKELTNIARNRVRFAEPTETELRTFEEAKEKEKEKEPGPMERGFRSLFDFEGGGTKYRSLMQAKPSMESVKKDRTEMLKDIKALKSTNPDRADEIKALLGSSLYDHGFTSYSKENGKVLAQTTLDYDDVIIFADEAEMEDVTIERWGDVRYKLTNRIPLNKEDEEIFEELKIYKLYTDEQIDNLIDRQRELMELRNSRIVE
jgi:hypothetical protein